MKKVTAAVCSRFGACVRLRVAVILAKMRFGIVLFVVRTIKICLYVTGGCKLLWLLVSLEILQLICTVCCKAERVQKSVACAAKRSVYIIKRETLNSLIYSLKFYLNLEMYIGSWYTNLHRFCLDMLYNTHETFKYVSNMQNGYGCGLRLLFAVAVKRDERWAGVLFRC